MAEEKKLKTITAYLYMLNMIYYILVAIPLVAFLFLYLSQKLVLSENGFIGEDDLIVKIGLALISVAIILIGEFSFKKYVKKDHQHHFLASKLQHYYNASIKRYLAYGLSAFIAVLGFYLYLEGLFVGMYMIALFTFSLIRPTKKALSKSGIFNEEEMKIIQEEDVIA